MSFSFSSLVRLIVVTGLGVTLLAIGLSKLDPPRPNLRTPAATKYFNVNEYLIKQYDRAPRWIDTETGEVVTSILDDGDVLEAASCAPWVDEKGQHQVVGRWSSRTSTGPMSISTDFGLARYSFPGGQLLDHVSTDIVPVGPPCWFPGKQARVLFVAGDGELYQYAFESDPYVKELEPAAKRDEKPTVLRWRCPKPGEGEVFLSDVTWPEDPRMIGYVIVALREQSRGTNPLRPFTATSLWWLKLDHAGTEIVEVGRLLLPPDPDHPARELDERSPTIGTLPGGKLALAYLSEGEGKKSGWELHVAPIEFEGDHHSPVAHEASGVRLSTECLPSHPSFSADGRWLNAIVESSQTNGRILRLPVTQLFRPSS
jgi:hypothetical protein